MQLLPGKMVFPVLFNNSFGFPQLTPSEEAFLRNYAGVVHSQMSQLPQHNIDQGKARERTLTIQPSVFETVILGAGGDVRSVLNHRLHVSQ